MRDKLLKIFTEFGIFKEDMDDLINATLSVFDPELEKARMYDTQILLLMPPLVKKEDDDEH